MSNFPIIMEENYVTFVTVSVPRLHNLEKQIPLVMSSDHIDRVIVVTGVRDEESEEWLKNLNPKGKLFIIYREWDGDFPAQYNTYLQYLQGGWVIICDDDEIPSDELLASLKPLIRESQGGSQYDVVAFRGRQKGHGWGVMHNRKEGEGDYYREIFYKWNSNLRYTTEVHQSLQGLHGPQMQREELFYHIKDTVDLWRNACRSFFVGGRWNDNQGKDPITEGVKGPEWHALHDILKRNHPEVKLFPRLHRLMISGETCQEFREWAKQYSDNDLPAGGELASYHAYQEYLDSLPDNADIKTREVLE